VAGLRAAISSAATDKKLDIALVSKVQVMRSHSVSAEGGKIQEIQDLIT